MVTFRGSARIRLYDVITRYFEDGGLRSALARATISATVRGDGVEHSSDAKWSCSAVSCCSRVMAAQISSSRSVGTAHEEMEGATALAAWPVGVMVARIGVSVMA